MAAGRRRLTRGPGEGDLRLVPLPVDVARRMLAGDLEPEAISHWHPEYPLPDSLDAIAMALAAHQAMTGASDGPPTWWIHHIVVDGVVVGDIGFHGPPGPDRVVEIGYSVVPAWRRQGVATRACDLILQQAWRDGAEIVIAETDHDNVASQAVLMSNGFQPGEGRDLIAPLAFARSARIAPVNSPTSSSLADDKACLLTPPQHGEGRDPCVFMIKRPEVR
jgi:[ribosomal protein S5]-alanine N-acetyltransferase